MNLWMDPLGDPLTTHPIQTGWQFTIELYPSWQFAFIDHPNLQFGKGCRWTTLAMWRCGSVALGAALWETRILVSSSEMSVQSSISFTSIRMEKRFAHIGINTWLLKASQGEEAIKTQCTMADSVGVSSDQWTASGLEASQESSDIMALPATHNTHDTHDTHDVSFTDTINNAKSIRSSSRFKSSTTAGFQPTELRTTEYVTNRMKVIVNGPGVMSD